MSVTRILKHWAMAPIPVSWFFSKDALRLVTECIENCEDKTSAEFRLIIERSMPADELRKGMSCAQRARELFGQYGVWDTEDNNGVLIYLNLTDHAIEIFLDRRAARVISPEALQSTVRKIEERFGQKEFAQGICEAFESLTELLAPTFPNKPVVNPVSNEPVIL